LFYNSDVDKVCLIIDRDAQNFKANQYDALLAACDKKGFSLHVSNPCFEIWLLMHYPTFRSNTFNSRNNQLTSI